jgi:hypothetical protein
MADIDQDFKDSDHDKVHITHSERPNLEMDSQMSAWECILYNPKIVLWTVYANGMSLVHCITISLAKRDSN